jgi:hypothetical protein
MFGTTILNSIKAAIMKYKDKGGNPEVLDMLSGAERGLVVLNNFVSKFSASDVETVLNSMPPQITAKFAPGELTAIATAIAELPTAIQKAEAVLTEWEDDLKQ